MENDQVKGLFDLRGKKVLVTGGNGGLGLGFARGIAKQGGDLILWGRSQAKNREAEEDLRQYGGKVIALVVDVGSEDAVAEGMRQAVDLFGRIDCVIANAGISTPAPSVLAITGQLYHELLQVNQHGAFFTLREAARHMVERAAAGNPGGSLIVCGSLSIYRGVPGLAHYAAAKGALAAITKSMAAELGKYEIRVNMIAPGYVSTGLGGERDSRRIALDETFSERSPMRRLGGPADFEAIAAYLASDGSSFHTGDTIVIDGGWLVNMM